MPSTKRPSSKPSVLLFSTVLLSVSLFGCGSYVLPPALTVSERTLVRSTHFFLTVGVETYERREYSDRLVTALRYTGLFDDVQPLDQLPDPDLIARVERPVYDGEGLLASLPPGKLALKVLGGGLTVITIGVFPYWITEEYGEVFSLRGRSSSEAVYVDFNYEGIAVSGWVAPAMNRSPNRSALEPRTTGRYYAALAARIASKGTEIERLSTP